MNLRFALLVRMTVVGTLCWLAASAYLVAQSGQREAQESLKIADQIRPIMTWDVMRRIGSIDADARYPDLEHLVEAPIAIRDGWIEGSEAPGHGLILCDKARRTARVPHPKDPNRKQCLNQ
jgi:hypothetical protein